MSIWPISLDRYFCDNPINSKCSIFVLYYFYVYKNHRFVSKRVACIVITGYRRTLDAHREQCPRSSPVITAKREFAYAIGHGENLDQPFSFADNTAQSCIDEAVALATVLHSLRVGHEALSKP